MVTPGRWRHFRGAHYQVLFIATWEDQAPPRSEQPCTVHAESYARSDAKYAAPVRLAAFAALNPDECNSVCVVKPLWVGGAVDVPRGTSIVVYANSDGVYARTEAEFEKHVTSFAGGSVARFISDPIARGTRGGLT